MRTRWLRFFPLLLLTVTCSAAPTNTWQWQSTLTPRALLFEGVWSDLFQVEPGLHAAGARYQSFYMTDLPRQYPDLHQQSVIVLVNAAAPYLEQQQIKDFVANGGGLVVLGGFWAFNCGGYHGGYKDGVLGDTLPVTWPTNFDIPNSDTGWPLTRAASATWLTPFDAAAKPMVYYRHTFIPKPDTTVQLMAGDSPVIVSHTFGKGRVVAIGLTVNGDPPPDALAFWNWPEWPRILGQAIDWASGGRPPGVTNRPASSLKPLTKDELNDLSLGMKVPANLVARARAYPNAETAQALFDQLQNTESKLTVAQVLPVLLPYAKAGWESRLSERASEQNPSLEDRQSTLILIGATRGPTVAARLLNLIAKPEIRLAVIEGLGYSGDPSAIPTLSKIYEDALRAARVSGESERFNAEVFAGGQAELATAAALALYRVGDPNGVERAIAMHRRALLYWHVYHSAGRGSLRHAGRVAIERMHNIWDRTERLASALEKLNNHDLPIPASQVANIVKAAQTATDPADVEWIAAELERSFTTLPASTWQSLATAKDGTIARLARTALETK